MRLKVKYTVSTMSRIFPQNYPDLYAIVSMNMIPLPSVVILHTISPHNNFLRYSASLRNYVRLYVSLIILLHC